MAEIYPIMIGGKEAGTLEIRQEGIRTVFRADCMDRGRIVRLAVCGESAYYLGVMMPDGNGHLHLNKIRSILEMKNFPKNVRYAAPEEEFIPENVVPKAENFSEERADNTDETPDVQRENVSDVISAAEAERNEEDTEQEDTDTVLWRKGAGGALAGSCGELRFLAVPLKSGIAPIGENFVRKMIENTEYAVFEIKNGKIK